MIANAAYDNWVGLAFALGAFGYLLAVLIFPERF
jgi:K+-transporting ATPase KdpF subunit